MGLCQLGGECVAQRLLRSRGGAEPRRRLMSPNASYRLHGRGASFDKLRMRQNLGGTKEGPHPELVEGRTALIPASVTSAFSASPRDKSSCPIEVQMRLPCPQGERGLCGVALRQTQRAWIP